MSDQYYEVDKIIRVQAPTQSDLHVGWFRTRGYPEHNRYVKYEELSESLQALYFKNGKRKSKLMLHKQNEKLLMKNQKNQGLRLTIHPPLEVEEGPVNPDGSIQLIRPAKKPKVIDYNSCQSNTLFQVHARVE